LTERAKSQSIAASACISFFLSSRFSFFFFLKQVVLQIINQSQSFRSTECFISFFLYLYIYIYSPHHLVTPLSELLGGEQAKVNKTTTDALNTYGNVQPGESITVTSTTTTTTVVSKNGSTNTTNRDNDNNNNNNNKPNFNHTKVVPPYHFSAGTPYGGGAPGLITTTAAAMEPWAGIPPSPPPPVGPRSPLGSPRYMDNYGPIPLPPLDLGRPVSPAPAPGAIPINDVLEDDNSIVIGLRVYTQKSAPTLISGKLNE
jgi:hypothetical protein